MTRAEADGGASATSSRRTPGSGILIPASSWPEGPGRHRHGSHSISTERLGQGPGNQPCLPSCGCGITRGLQRATPSSTATTDFAWSAAALGARRLLGSTRGNGLAILISWPPGWGEGLQGHRGFLFMCLNCFFLVKDIGLGVLFALGVVLREGKALLRVGLRLPGSIRRCHTCLPVARGERRA
jgi:hypothetical protein